MSKTYGRKSSELGDMFIQNGTVYVVDEIPLRRRIGVGFHELVMTTGCWIADWQLRSNRAMRQVVVESREAAILTLRENLDDMILSTAQIVGPYRLDRGRWTYDHAEGVEDSDELHARVLE